MKGVFISLQYILGLSLPSYIDFTILYIFNAEFLSLLWIKLQFLFSHKVKPQTSIIFFLFVFMSLCFGLCDTLFKNVIINVIITVNGLNSVILNYIKQEKEKKEQMLKKYQFVKIVIIKHKIIQQC